MKRLWISVAILIFVFNAALFSNYVLKKATQDMTDLLQRAEDCYQAGEIQQALHFTQLARGKWDQLGGYLYTVLHHTESDDVLVLFTQVQCYLEQNEPGGEYAACNAALITKIKLLYEMEAFTVENLF